MKWIIDLFTNHSTVAFTILVYAIVIASGVAIGKLAFKGVSFGIACVLFTGIIAGHFGFQIEKEILEFIREFGLILFVYAMGLQVGPGFFASLQKQGLKLNLVAVLCVLLSVAVVVTIYFITDIPLPNLVGLMSGAVTNTPGLGAAQQTLKDLSSLHPELQNLPPMGTFYALAYPGGVLGIILTIIVFKWIYKINIEKEKQALFQKSLEHTPRPSTINLKVTNPSLNGKPVQALFDTMQSNFVVSRVYQNSQVKTASKNTVLHEDDVILVVAQPNDFIRLKTIVGEESKMDLTKISGPLVAKQIRITRKEACSRSLADMNTIDEYGVTITRILRSGIEFIPDGHTRLQFGDIVTAIGEEDEVQRLISNLGDSDKKLKEPHIAGLFLGIALGVIVGSIPFVFPGISVPVKLGLAGGPLIVAIFISRYASLFPLTSYVTQSANYMVREIGIVLFLASVGLKAGPDFVNTLTSAQGPVFLLIGFSITLIPLVVTAIISRLAFKLNYLEICGLMAGASTDPPALSFATQIAGSDAPAIAYAGVYPLTMFLRILLPQILLLLLL
ncbi:putative transporter [Chitinophagaceae bacterium LB-8]|uniref:Transporter n=1 Tax=Paraflavisolibacter caeni TaxID=2982496 RepID=A0A9X2XTL2_9BACT|nr:putative transporter [Paraflavisolibacter caeni]MCU7548131.1 putative transporter [Paraflavisolibacter caeni]